MDFIKIIAIVSLCICSVVFIMQIVKIIKFAKNCVQEGVKAIKFSFNVASVIYIALTIGFFIGVGYWFGSAAKANEDAKFFEEMKSDELVEYFAELQEEKKGIVILDPEKYYLENIEDAKATAQASTWLAISLLIWSIDGILTIIGMFCVITSKGFRNSRIKDAIPIFAEYDRQNGRIIIKVNDLTGKVEKLFSFAASPRNLASLGQFIVWDEEQTIQEEIQ